jgi:hypothetical protein
VRGTAPPCQALDRQHERQDHGSDDSVQPEVVGCYHYGQRRQDRIQHGKPAPVAARGADHRNRDEDRPADVY